MAKPGDDDYNTCFDCGGPTNGHGQCDACDRKEGKL